MENESGQSGRQEIKNKDVRKKNVAFLNLRMKIFPFLKKLSSIISKNVFQPYVIQTKNMGKLILQKKFIVINHSLNIKDILSLYVLQLSHMQIMACLCTFIQTRANLFDAVDNGKAIYFFFIKVSETRNLILGSI